MKTFTKSPLWKVMLLFIASGLLLTACEKLNSFENNNKISDNCPSTAPFDLDVVLVGDAKQSGTIKFKQDPDVAKIITLDICVQKLKPDHEYLLQRAVDTINELDCNCLSTTWLSLGKGLVSQSIVTDKHGKGSEVLWRDVTAVPSGAVFDIHFQVIDATSLEVVLKSACYQYTVR